ncbi:MAG: hypothetical protein NWS87_01435 [Sediminibacterium sp.]|jgi:hypothetical protein|nr:hypothetical protein [Sediminibacterium sp.]MDP4619158.1 hypothetical protein [Sediminibacterium sp.]
MRRNVSLFTLLLIGLGIGWMIKNVKIGLIIGLVLGLLISGIGTRSK